ncbi:MAG: site-specific integrase [Rhodospirillales bacterium]|nr:site-specific integrase [Rhodospirillales bacterium]
MAKLTKRIVDAAEPDGRDWVLWDDEIKGFGLRLRASGAKVYLVQYRAGQGRRAPSRRYTIGRHGSPWTPDAARREAKRVLGLVAAGADPAAERKEKRRTEQDALTVREVAERWLAEHVEAKRKPRTATEYRRLLRHTILPQLGDRKIAKLTRADVARLHDANRHAPYVANRCLAVISSMANWAEVRGLRPEHSNPCHKIEKFKEQGRERFLSPRELQRLSRALDRAERSGAASVWAVAAVRLLVLTGARLNEILTARWEWIDLAGGTLALPDSKSGKKVVHLNAPAAAVLAALPRLPGNPHVICGANPGAHLVNLEKPWRRIRKAALLADVRLHDLRHSFASVAVAGGATLPLIGALLGHSQPSTTHRYSHFASDPLKAAAEQVGERIAAAMARPAAAPSILRSGKAKIAGVSGLAREVSRDDLKKCGP